MVRNARLNENNTTFLKRLQKLDKLKLRFLFCNLCVCVNCSKKKIKIVEFVVLEVFNCVLRFFMITCILLDIF